MESDLKCLKHLLTGVCQMDRGYRRTPKVWQTMVIIPIHQRGDRRECTRHQRISYIAPMENFMPRALKQKDTQRGFHPGRGNIPPGRGNTDKTFILQQIYDKSWECTKVVYACFVDFEKYTTGFLVKSCGKCCGSTVLTPACYWLSIHCIPAQEFVSVSATTQFVITAAH